MQVDYDYTLLKALMREKNLTQLEISEALKISESTFSLKINSKSEFKHSEIEKIAELLDIAPERIGKFFFTHLVQKN